MQIDRLNMHNIEILWAEMDSAGEITIESIVYQNIGFQKVLFRGHVKDICTSQFNMDINLFRK